MASLVFALFGLAWFCIPYRCVRWSKYTTISQDVTSILNNYLPFPAMISLLVFPRWWLSLLRMLRGLNDFSWKQLNCWLTTNGMKQSKLIRYTRILWNHGWLGVSHWTEAFNSIFKFQIPFKNCRFDVILLDILGR